MKAMQTQTKLHCARLLFINRDIAKKKNSFIIFHNILDDDQYRFDCELNKIFTTVKIVSPKYDFLTHTFFFNEIHHLQD